MIKVVNLIWFFAFSLGFSIINRGYNHFFLLLAFISLVFLFKNRKNKLILNHSSKIWIYSLIICFFVEIIAKIILKESIYFYKNSKSIILIIPIVILLFYYRPNLKTYFYSLFLGIIVYLALIVYHKFFSSYSHLGLKAILHYIPHHTVVSDILITMATLIACAGIYFFKKGNKFLAILGILGTSLGILAAVLSGGRGSFLLIPPSLVILMIYLNKEKFLRNFLTVSFLIFGSFTILYFIPQSNLKNRVSSFVEDFSEYAKGNPRTSQGLRIELYKCAYSLAGKSPIYGLGEPEQVLKEMGEGNFCHSDLKTFPHFHNDFIEQYIHYGILGVLSFFILLFFPIFYALKILLRNKNLENEFLAYSTICLSSCYFFAGLSDTFLLPRSDLNFFLLLNAFFISGIKYREK